MNNMSKPILYIVICFSLSAVAFIISIPETNDNLPLWIAEKNTTNSSNNNIVNLIGDEMGAIYVPSQSSTQFQRSSINMRYNWFLTEMFVEVMAQTIKQNNEYYYYICIHYYLKTFIISDKNKTFNTFLPFIFMSIIAVIPLIRFEYIFKTIEPIYSNKLLYQININKFHVNNNENITNNNNNTNNSNDSTNSILGGMLFQLKTYDGGN